MNPFIAFCLYVAARVLVQYLKSSPHDSETRSSLEFLLTALTALRRLNPLSESFLIQLNLDMQGSGLDILLHNPDFSSIVKDKVVRKISTFGCFFLANSVSRDLRISKGAL